MIEIFVKTEDRWVLVDAVYSKSEAQSVQKEHDVFRKMETGKNSIYRMYYRRNRKAARRLLCEVLPRRCSR